MGIVKRLIFLSSGLVENFNHRIMSIQLSSKIVSELVWLLGIIVVSAAIEYAIIMLFDLHPILSVKLQALIGLVVVAYGIRMIARLGSEGQITIVDDDDKEAENYERQSQPN